ncbi:MAG TPA: tRNA 4-thiouridine(8) synthase ThiI [Syntrophothermus lipocalidus]|nr:tRNA 4-thiouridine(8) synthase ThiI [Syntrophothermus lipocalidus]
MYDAVLVRYGEIGLKGANRWVFESILLQNIRMALQGLKNVSVVKRSGRILVQTNGSQDEVLARLARVFGIVSISPVITVDSEMQDVMTACSALVGFLRGKIKTFKVETRRAHKTFPYTSPEISRIVGGHLLRRYPALQVDVHAPDVTIYIELRAGETYVYFDVIPGPGGLPVGASGKGLLLLSGGLDSPVAGWLAMKRGIRLSAIHFYSFPFTSERSKKKVIDLGQVLAWYNQGITLHVVNFTPIQETIMARCPEKYRVTILRRMMLRVAEEIAVGQRIQCLITGESVGQVASQTLESMSVIGSVTRVLLLRPLAGLDKTDIVAIARKIGTYEISILPYEDCCSMFVPKHPATKPKLDIIVEAESKVDWEPLLREAVETVETLDVDATWLP